LHLEVLQFFLFSLTEVEGQRCKRRHLMAQPKDSGDTEGQDGQSIVLKGKPDDLLAMVDEDMGLSTLGKKKRFTWLALGRVVLFLD